MTVAERERRYSPGEEIAHSVIHGVGIVLAIAGLAVLAAFSSLHGTAAHIVGCSVFGTTLILLYTTSTLYHSIPLPRAKTVLRALDHSAIFVLIAGTYTPFSLVSLRGPWGWSLLGVIWSLAILGIVVRVRGGRKSNAAAVGFYIAMGWTVLLVIKPLAANVAPGGVFLLALGGVVYTAGAAFYLWRRLPYHHAIWHAFVLLGSILHFFAILFYVIPLASPSSGAMTMEPSSLVSTQETVGRASPEATRSSRSRR
jgi:hemolysin III